MVLNFNEIGNPSAELEYTVYLSYLLLYLETERKIIIINSFGNGMNLSSYIFRNKIIK